MHDRRRRLWAAILSGTMLATVLAAAPASAATFTLSTLSYGSNCIYGTGVTGAVYRARLLEGTTALTSASDTADGYGYFSICFPTRYELVAGYKLEVKSGTNTRTITIPNLALRTDRFTNVISGKGPAGKKLKVVVTAYAPGDYANYSTYVRFPVANSSGDWSINFTGAGGIIGGDSVSLYYKANQDYASSTGDTWRLDMDVEYMHLYRGASQVWGSMNMAETATITLKTAAGIVRGRAGVGPDGYDGDYQGYFRTSAGAVVRPNATDKVSATFASDANVTIPNITVAGNGSTNVISGTCMAFQGFYVYARKPDYSDSASRYGTTNGSGVFSVNVGADMNLAAGDYISVECKYDNGDEIQREGVSG